jgi:hypothetical protein
MAMKRLRRAQNATMRHTSLWDAAFAEMQRARATNTAPRPEFFQNLTKSAGGK